MNFLDWLVLVITIASVSFYGIWRNRRSQNLTEYLLAARALPWYTVALSIIATHASAITFLSAPGEGYFNGVGFVQFYLGLPIAMFVVARVFLPRFYQAHILTAYELLENTFGAKVRVVTASLFLLQRGLAAGLVISAPALILTEVLGWNFYLTTLFMGGTVVLYTTIGGSAAISQTQFQQMLIILAGMIWAGYQMVADLPPSVDFAQALHFAKAAGKLTVFTTDIKSKYNIWSGLIGGCFLALAYFGTDQSQVERYLSGKSVEQSKKGLLFNGLFKLPMQFCILLLGALLFVYYQFNSPPIFFNTHAITTFQQAYPADIPRLNALTNAYQNFQTTKQNLATAYVQSPTPDKLKAWQTAQTHSEDLRNEAIELLKKSNKKVSDKNYLFLYYVLHQMPHGWIGLLIAVIFFASMSTTASEINALASVSLVDIYRKYLKLDGSDAHYVAVSRGLTVVWAIIAVSFALTLRSSSTFIEYINILGSLFYGVILAIFLLAFYAPKSHPNAVLLGALVGEIAVLFCYLYSDISYLWYNVLGCLITYAVAILGGKRKDPSSTVASWAMVGFGGTKS